MIEQYRRADAGHFEAAIWSDETLCGLAIGKPSRAKTILSVHYIEGNPDLTPPLKGFAHIAALEAAHAYAFALNATLLKLCEPIPEMVGRYTKLGFRHVLSGKESSYCEREV